MAQDLEELITFLRSTRGRMFVKTENYVPAHLTPTKDGGLIGDDWSEEKMRDYLYGEAMLNNGGSDKDFSLCRKSISIFFGDAQYHGWVRHYRVRKVDCGSTWTYEWERVL